MDSVRLMAKSLNSTQGLAPGHRTVALQWVLFLVYLVIKLLFFNLKNFPPYLFFNGTSFHLIRSSIILVVTQIGFPVRATNDKTKLDPLSLKSVTCRVIWQP